MVNLNLEQFLLLYNKVKVLPPIREHKEGSYLCTRQRSLKMPHDMRKHVEVGVTQCWSQNLHIDMNVLNPTCKISQCFCTPHKNVVTK